MGRFLHDYHTLIGDRSASSASFMPPYSHEDVVQYAQFVVSNMIGKLQPGASVTLERHPDPSKEPDGRTFTLHIKTPIDGYTNV